jgi:putative thioredoxin
MSEVVSDFVIDVSENDFERAVIDRSQQVPVLVDFWATWCGPCRTLGPVLERLAEEFNGAFILARVNTDENPNLAGQLGIRSIPNVILFRDGQAVDQFIGALPEPEVREFVRQYCPTEADQLATAGDRFFQREDKESAAHAYQQALSVDANHAGAHLGLARIALLEGREAEVKEHLAAISPLAAEAEAARHVREALSFQTECRAAGGEDNCRQRLAQSPDDLDAGYGLACCLAAAGRYKEALDAFLAIVTKNKRYRDEAARRAMLTIFSLIGERSELAEEYRTKLAWTLY